MGGNKYKMPSNKYFLKKKFQYQPSRHVFDLSNKPDSTLTPRCLVHDTPRMYLISRSLEARREYSLRQPYQGRIADPRKDPVWVYLEKEMRANIDKKPYNKKVGSWLAFLKDLKQFYRCERKGVKKKMLKEVGPRWFIEFSPVQRKVLEGLREDIHHDEIINVPIRIRKSLSNLGITKKLNSFVLMKAVSVSVGDPGIFLWSLFEQMFDASPSTLLPKYDLDAMIIMSSFVFIDFNDCVQVLEDLTKYKNKSRPVVPKKKKSPGIPQKRYGEYLQKNYVTLYSNNRSEGPKPRPKPKPLGTKCRFRSNDSYTAIRLTLDFLEKRRKKNFLEMQKERVCNYKFWEPPSSIRNTDPKQAAYAERLKVLKKKANRHFKTPYNNLTVQLAGVSFVGDRPQYILSNSVALPTGYTIVNNGIVSTENGEGYTHIQGHWKGSKKERTTCKPNCDCLEKWEQTAMDHIKKSKCNCKHFYDFHHTGKCKDRYFYPPTRNAPFWVDTAKVFRINPLEDFVRKCVKTAVRSDPATPNMSIPSIPLATVSIKKLLKALLAEISDSSLIIPHLPQAHLLNNLLEWIRKRVRGKLTPKQERKHKLVSQRRWLQLKHLGSFRANCYYIPFTLKQLANMTFEHRDQINKLLKVLLKNFIKRNRQKQVELGRLLWPTTKYDAYPQKAFLDTFFTYMPSRIQDSYLINPYSSENTPKTGAKTCPLSI